MTPWLDNNPIHKPSFGQDNNKQQQRQQGRTSTFLVEQWQQQHQRLGRSNKWNHQEGKWQPMTDQGTKRTLTEKNIPGAAHWKGGIKTKKSSFWGRRNVLTALFFVWCMLQCNRTKHWQGSLAVLSRQSSFILSISSRRGSKVWIRATNKIEKDNDWKSGRRVLCESTFSSLRIFLPALEINETQFSLTSNIRPIAFQ